MAVNHKTQQHLNRDYWTFQIILFLRREQNLGCHPKKGMFQAVSWAQFSDKIGYLGLQNACLPIHRFLNQVESTKKYVPFFHSNFFKTTLIFCVRGKRSTMTQRRVRGRFQMIENSPLNAIIDFAFVLKRSREFKKGSFSTKGENFCGIQGNMG